ncbi:hypothetical protein EVJ24_12190 [Exiguobacterium sp. SH1S21]|uniref:hypothetical protein n=1 Tax=unclassified Exiguobacterium TaxID=2644629 RepID=UPI00103D4125|nr:MULTISPECIES: hypothetical protein [unclassified Exiguobacterium]TCI51888.1 hypothetical protein EVJ24_12190 [Exiguobacterium sp. SH1S21]TCI69021.1 hypothetical protein EVJ22_11140 [Exiguobacterium sp. SH0S7]
MKSFLQSGGIVGGLLVLLVLPLLLLDIGLIWLLERSLSAPLSLLIALCCFYSISFGFGLLIDGFGAVLASLRYTRALPFLRAVGHLATSAGSLYSVTWLFPNVALSPLTMSVIVFVHWLGAHLWLRNDSPGKAGTAPNDSLDHQIVQMLRTATVPDCVETIQQQYPNVSKLEILRRVRRISR